MSDIARVAMGLRWTPSFHDSKTIALTVFAIKIIYSNSKILQRSLVLEKLSSVLSATQFIKYPAEFQDHLMSSSLSSVNQKEKVQVLTRSRIEPSILDIFKHYLKENISTVSARYVRDGEFSINPAYQTIETVSASLFLNQKKIWLLRSDGILAVGYKNATWISFGENNLSQAIDPNLHAYVN